MPNYLIMDIESFFIKNDIWKPPENDPKMFAPLSFHGVSAIGGLFLEINSKFNRCIRIGTFGTTGDESHELSRIEGFLEYYRKTKPILVTFNGRGFDIPVLWMRAMHHGISIPEFFEYDFTYKFSQKKHYDFAEKMFEHGAIRREKLMYLCSIIGLPGKPEVDGSMVHKLFAAGEYEKIASYVQCDVIEEALVFIKYLHVRGELSTGLINNLIYSIRSKAKNLNDPLVTNLINLIDFSTLEVKDGQPQAQKGEFSEETISSEKEDGIPF